MWRAIVHKFRRSQNSIWYFCEQNFAEKISPNFIQNEAYFITVGVVTFRWLYFYLFSPQSRNLTHTKFFMKTKISKFGQKKLNITSTLTLSFFSENVVKHTLLFFTFSTSFHAVTRRSGSTFLSRIQIRSINLRRIHNTSSPPQIYLPTSYGKWFFLYIFSRILDKDFVHFNHWEWMKRSS